MKKGEMTRQHIIETAAKVFNRSGYGSTSMTDLMHATGLEKGGLYRHFSSKEELAIEAFAHAVEVAFRPRDEAMQAADPGLSRLRAFIQGFASGKPPIAGGCPVFNTAVENDFGNAALKKKSRAAYQLWIKRLATAVGEAQEAREIRADVDRESLAAFILCSLEGALIAANLTSNKAVLGQTGEHLLQYLQGIAIESNQDLKYCKSSASRP